jgi:hypothetical protein
VAVPEISNDELTTSENQQIILPMLAILFGKCW